MAGVRVGLLPELGFVVNPTVQQMEESKLDLIMAGTDSAVLMIEGYCDFLTEDQMLEVSFPCCPRDVSFAVPGTSPASHCCPRDICCFSGTPLASQGCISCRTANAHTCWWAEASLGSFPPPSTPLICCRLGSLVSKWLALVKVLARTLGLVRQGWV